MGYAIEMYFDENGSKMIEEIWQALYEKEASTYMVESGSKPHITLAVYDEDFDDLQRFKDQVKAFANGLGAFTLDLTNIGIFSRRESVLFIGPKVTEELLALHRKFHETMKAYEDFEWPYYLPEQWVPHCTMGINLDGEKLLESVGIISGEFQPVTVKIESIGIVKFRPVEFLEEFELSDEVNQ